MTRRLPEPDEVVYIRVVVSQVLRPGDPDQWVLARPLTDKCAIDITAVFGPDVGVHPDVIVFPKEKQKWKPPKGEAPCARR